MANKYVLSAVAVTTLFLGGCGSHAQSAAGKSTFDVVGTLTITDNGMGLDEGDSCDSNPNYISDLAYNAPIEVADSNGKTVAFSRLPHGTAVLNNTKPTVPSFRFHDCVIKFTVKHVPSGSPVYELTIGDRDPVKFTKAEAGALDLSISAGAANG